MKSNASPLHSFLIVLLSLVLIAAIAAGSFLICFYHTSVLSYSELDFENYSLNPDGTFVFTLHPKTDGEYLYSCSTVLEGEKLRLILRGGKQSSLAASADASAESKTSVTFTVTVPEGVTQIVCDTHTVYTIRND